MRELLLFSSTMLLLLIISCDNKKTKASINPVGVWGAEFDISNVSEGNEVVLGLIAAAKYSYEFKSDSTGIRKASAFGMTQNEAIIWSVTGDTLNVAMDDRVEKMVLEGAKLRIVDNKQEVVIYLVQ